MTENDNRNSGNSGNQETTPAQAPAAPAPKPSGPPNVVFKGGVDSSSKLIEAIKESSDKGSDKR